MTVLRNLRRSDAACGFDRNPPRQRVLVRPLFEGTFLAGTFLARICLVFCVVPLGVPGVDDARAQSTGATLNGLNPALLSTQGNLGNGAPALPTPLSRAPFGLQPLTDPTTAGLNAPAPVTANGTPALGNPLNPLPVTGNRATRNQASGNPRQQAVGQATGRTGAPPPGSSTATGNGTTSNLTTGSLQTNPNPFLFNPRGRRNIGRAGTLQGGVLATGVLAPTAPGAIPQTARAPDFDPLGLGVGKFTLRPSIDIDTGFTSNSTRDVSGASSAFVSVNPQLLLESNFARHALGLQVQAGFDRFATGSDTTDREVIVTATGRFDIDAERSINAAVQYAAQEDDITGVADDPLETTTTASLGLNYRLKDVDTRSTIRIARNINGGFVDAAGIDQSQDDLDSTLYGANLRATLARGASLQPFVEGDISREVFDQDEDILGNGRNVIGLRGLVGVAVNRGEKLNGEFAIGYGENLVDGDGIDDFGAFLAEFNLNWSPQRLTEIRLAGTTTLDAFPSVATPGDTTYDINLTLAREVRENLTATAGTGLIFQVDGGNLGTDTTVEAQVGLEYRVSRTLGIVLNYDYARQFTAGGAADFTANTISLGLRAER